jgi:uncharacterized membrane protein YjfL (UPF0719 family)
MIDEVRSKGSFDWLATVFYPLAVVLMEACWVYPWLVWLGSWPMFAESRPLLSLASVVITLAVSLLVTRLIIRQKWSMWRIRFAIIGGGLVVILLVLGVDYRAGFSFLSGRWFGHIFQALGATFSSPQTVVIAIPVLLYLWWRGIILGQTTSYFRDIYRTFILGMVALIFLIIVWQITAASERFTGPGSDIGWYIMAFFFFGLISIAVCHLYLMRSSMPREEAGLTSVWRSLPMMLVVIVVVVLVGFGVASIFSPELFESIGHGFKAAGGFLGKIIPYILWPIIFVFEWLVRIFVYLINLLSGSQTPSENITGNVTFLQWPEVISKQLPPWATEAIKWSVVALVVGLVLFILARAVSRMRARRARDEIEEIHESLWSWKGLRDDLRELLGMLGKRFKRKPATPAYRFDENAAGRMDIREIYRHVLWEGAHSGLARRRHETPSEYSGRMAQSVPESDEPLKNITHEYENVRYGENIVPEERVEKANSLWQKLKGLLRKLRGDQ